MDAKPHKERVRGRDEPTHGRHCRCSACEREDWTQSHLAPCGMHGASCPPVYDPWPKPESNQHSRPNIDALRERCLGMPSNVTMAHDFLDVLAYVRSIEEQLEATQRQRDEMEADCKAMYQAKEDVREQYQAAQDALRRIDRLIGEPLSDEECYEAITSLTRPFLGGSTPATSSEEETGVTRPGSAPLVVSGEGRSGQEAGTVASSDSVSSPAMRREGD